MPFAEIRKIRQTIGFELETLIASPVENLLIDFVVIGRTGSHTSLIAAMVDRTYVGEHLAGFASNGAEPEVLDIRNVSLVNQIMQLQDSPGSGILLCLDSAGCAMLLFHEKRIVLIRNLAFSSNDLATVAGHAAKGEETELAEPGRYENNLLNLCRTINLTLRGFQVEAGVHYQPEKVFITGPGALLESTELILGKELNLPVSAINLVEEISQNIQLRDHLKQLYNPALMDNALALALRDGKKTKGFNFRREEFQVRTGFVKIKKELTQAAVFLGIIFILLAVNFGIDYRDLKSRNAALDKRIKELFSETFPEVTNVVDPMHQMKTKISELKKASGAAPGINSDRTFLEILNDISDRIPARLELKVDRMVVDRDGIQLRGTTDTFNTVDSIKKGLESSDKYHDVTIASANLDKSGKGVRFEIKMDRTL
jgi:general secretion pathway protein L